MGNAELRKLTGEIEHVLRNSLPNEEGNTIQDFKVKFDYDSILVTFPANAIAHRDEFKNFVKTMVLPALRKVGIDPSRTTLDGPNIRTQEEYWLILRFDNVLAGKNKLASQGIFTENKRGTKMSKAMKLTEKIKSLKEKKEAKKLDESKKEVKEVKTPSRSAKLLEKVKSLQPKKK